MWQRLKDYLLSNSRKVNTGVTTWLIGAIVWLGGYYGLDLPMAILAPLAGSVVLVGLVLIGATALEDAAVKGAGNTTVEPAFKGGPTVVKVTTTDTAAEAMRPMEPMPSLPQPPP